MNIDELFYKLFQKACPKNKINLLSFSPQKTPESNRYVIKQLKAATSIRNRHDNNVALDGDYGVGKSSILYELRQDLVWRTINRPKVISFLSFPAIEKENESSQDKRIDSGFLQGEIIRQLYYGENANKLKGSGYKRLGKSYFLASVLIGATLGTFLLLQIFQIDAPTFFGVIIEYFNGDIGSDVVSAYLIAWIVVASAITLMINNLLKLISNGNIKNISTKDLSIELSDSESDFSQLIDLLVYYFHKTRRRVVIFEDLDRLQNPRIFEELRQLNFTLNNTNKRFWTIKFIYATRSDLFCAKATKDTGIEKINTKVFDLIIPVIPFLTKINFSNLLQRECQKIGLDRKVNGLENILSRHTSDMRVVKAVLNNILVHENTFELRTDADYKNAAALSILRVFAPKDYMKLSTGDCLLDLVRERCSLLKEDSIRAAREKSTPEYRIGQQSENIWSEIRHIGNQLPQHVDPQSVTINNKQIAEGDDPLKTFLVQIYRVDQESTVQIFWKGYGARDYTAHEIQGIIASRIGEGLLDASGEEEVSKLIEKDCFTFYDGDPQTFSKKEVDEATRAIVKELLENDFITEGYTRFITQASETNYDIDIALRYIFGYIRSSESNKEYALSPAAALEVINRIDNTDLLSTGMYNFDLFDYLIKNINQYSGVVDRILQNAKNNLDSFMEFFDSYCCRYKSQLEFESCVGLSESVVIELSSSLPPAFLAMKLARLYPKETLTMATHSLLRDTNAKEVIYNIVVLSLSDPLDLVLEDQDRSFLEYYADMIMKNAGGKENLFKLFIANHISFNNWGDFDVSGEDVIAYLDKIIITINDQNLTILDDDVLIDYIVKHQLSTDDFRVIMRSNRAKVKQYVVKNISKVMVNESLPESLREAAAYICDRRISLGVDELLQYAGETSMENLIKMILASDLAKEEVVTVLSKCNDGNLSKIQTSGSRIKLDSNKTNDKLAEKLVALGLVKRWHSRDNKLIKLQVL